MKILDFDLEGSHFIIEADIAPRQEADDDMECQWLRYDFDNTQVYKETDGAVSPFQITLSIVYNLGFCKKYSIIIATCMFDFQQEE